MALSMVLEARVVLAIPVLWDLLLGLIQVMVDRELARPVIPIQIPAELVVMEDLVSL
jgi:hypothetical protein